MITVLGTGLLGAGFVRGLLGRGEVVHVWNRTPARAEALVADGAVAFADAAAAVRGTGRVHVVVGDDAAVDAVLEAAAPGLAPGTLVFDHSTTSTAGARARTAAWPARGVTYVHAPVFMGPGQALAATGLMLVSGDRALVERVRPLLAPMTGTLLDLGPRVDAAAATKLLGNSLLAFITAGLVDLLALARAMGVPPADVAALLRHFNPGAALPARLDRMLASAAAEPPWTDPSWTLAMARKDVRLMQAEAAAAAVPLATLPTIATRMDALLEAGLGDLDWTVLVRDVLPPRGP